MKNKKLLYVLIPVTLLIWGLIIQKVFSVVSGNDNGTPKQELTQITEEHFEMNDTFSINPIYRDPFKAIEQKKIASSTSSIQIKKITSPVKPLPNKWPSIVYGGIIKNQKSSKQLVLVSVNGQSNMMKTGEQLNDIQLLRVFKDSIEVKYGNEKRFVSK